MDQHSLPFTRYIAELAVLRAAVLTKRFMTRVSGIAKDDASPVTLADFGAQALIMAALHGFFPHDGFVGEEDAAVLRANDKLRTTVFKLANAVSRDFREVEWRSANAHSVDATLPALESEEQLLELLDLAGRGATAPRGRFWVMDPLDGTAAFLRGQQYAVSLALVEDGREVLGVVCYPNLSLEYGGVVSEIATDRLGHGIMLSAIRGEGAEYRRLPLDYSLGLGEILGRFTVPAKYEDLRLVDSTASKSNRLDLVEGVARQLGAVPFPGIDIYSSHARYAAMMIGEGEGSHVMIRIPVGRKGDPSKSYIWDHAGSQLVYTERGGKITDLEGKDIDFGAGKTLAANWGIVAAPEVVHERILRLVQEWIARDVEMNDVYDP
ncbi:hypothetical protein M441DRAFT_53522 [Trichoderma asperellum CBS 433.97]|uniref:3'(2'),5'-bisphosphate nucleotidase n=2 Tax=Trichoderma asperellum TaxID=101201 RepID=A0A2T3ZPT5_TRIA4|nr:hypothetical protein M441DRAFT_53522 [Trichoderma asperellum CBS 433.97]PTB46820.1 hypothetical protein M441DRAFT_53522 [Trichoderma asperellum CBS 433.97]